MCLFVFLFGLCIVRFLFVLFDCHFVNCLLVNFEYAFFMLCCACLCYHYDLVFCCVLVCSFVWCLSTCEFVCYKVYWDRVVFGRGCVKVPEKGCEANFSQCACMCAPPLCMVPGGGRAKTRTRAHVCVWWGWGVEWEWVYGVGVGMLCACLLVGFVCITPSTCGTQLGKTWNYVERSAIVLGFLLLCGDSARYFEDFPVF